jgi:hypothetical protein
MKMPLVPGFGVRVMASLQLEAETKLFPRPPFLDFSDVNSPAAVLRSIRIVGALTRATEPSFDGLSSPAQVVGGMPFGEIFPNLRS